MKILKYCNCLKFLCIKNENKLNNNEFIIHKKNIEIIDLKKIINKQNIKINNLEYKLQLRNNKQIQYNNYKITEDIENGYTIFE